MNMDSTSGTLSGSHRATKPRAHAIGSIDNREFLLDRLREIPLPTRTRRVTRDPIPDGVQRPAADGELPRPGGAKNLLRQTPARVPPVRGSRVGNVPG